MVAKMIASRHLIGELLGGISLAGLLSVAVQWGGITRAVADHVDPDRHALIVLAGNAETGKQIAVIENNVATIKDDIAEAKTERKEVREQLSDVQSDVKLQLELLKQALSQRAAAPPPPPE